MELRRLHGQNSCATEKLPKIVSHNLQRAGSVSQPSQTIGGSQRETIELTLIHVISKRDQDRPGREGSSLPGPARYRTAGAWDGTPWALPSLRLHERCDGAGRAGATTAT